MRSFKKVTLKRAKQMLRDQGVPYSEVDLIIMDLEHRSDRRWHQELNSSAFHLVAMGKITMTWDRQERSPIWTLLPGGEDMTCLVCGRHDPGAAALDMDDWVTEWWADPQSGVIGDREVCLDCARGMFTDAPDGRPCLRPELSYDSIEHMINVRK